MKLHNIIDEVIKSYLNEEMSDDETVDFTKINLQQEYDKYNSMLFNGELQKVPLRWDNSKRVLGHVRAMRNRLTREARIQHLSMSKFYALTYKAFKSVLAHEMIHVKQLQNNETDLIFDKHGRTFMREAERINNLNMGFKITPTNTDKLEVSDEIKEKMKPVTVLVFEIDGRFYFSVTSNSVYERDFDSIVRVFKHLVKTKRYRNVEITVIESTNPGLIPFPLRRSYRGGVRYHELKDDLLDELLDDNIIHTEKITPDNVSEDIETNVERRGDWEILTIV